MEYQLLVSTMNRQGFGLCDEMNIHSDALIINQSTRVRLDTCRRDGWRVEMYEFGERGIGLSRNSALMRAEADILEFADDDMIFTDTHRADVLREFRAHPEADAILFSVESLNPDRPLLKIDHFGRVSRREALKYGCARLAVRRERILYHNLSFSLLFGGGARYGSGEDTLFLQDCIRAGLKIYKSPVKVADVRQETSSWFQGYTERYYEDKGALFAAIFPRIAVLYAAASALKSRDSRYGKKEVMQLYLRGIRAFRGSQRRQAWKKKS